MIRLAALLLLLLVALPVGSDTGLAILSDGAVVLTAEEQASIQTHVLVLYSVIETQQKRIKKLQAATGCV